jgi:hypothetical protein
VTGALVGTVLRPFQKSNLTALKSKEDNVQCGDVLAGAVLGSGQIERLDTKLLPQLMGCGWCFRCSLSTHFCRLADWAMVLTGVNLNHYQNVTLGKCWGKK